MTTTRPPLRSVASTASERGWSSGLRWLQRALARPVPALVALVAVLVVGAPLMLARSLWVDATLYDVAARTVLRGGVHYRDLFDPNLPGMLWCHLLVRSLLGWSHVALRAVDLLVVSVVVLQLTRWAGLDRCAPATRLWLAASLFAFYFGLPEINQVQRDIWMLLPALAAVALRARQLGGAGAAASPARGGLLGVAEGLLWAVAFCFKPFVAVPAATCFALPLLRRERRRDLAPSFWWGALGVLGGGLVGLAALALWFRLSGAWPHYWRLIGEWAPEYGAHGAYSVEVRYDMTRRWLRDGFPWTLAIAIALFAGARTLAGAVEGGNADDRLAAARAVTAHAFFLGWTVQAIVVQPRLHAYVLTSVALLALSLAVPAIGSHWGRPGVFVALLALAIVALVRHPVASARQLAAWPRALVLHEPLVLRQELALHGPRTELPDWTALAEVAGFLRARGVGDRQVLAYHDSTHPLYLELDVAQPVRYMHLNLIRDTYLDQHARVLAEINAEINAAPLRFVVSDLVGVGVAPEADVGDVDPRWLGVFPWDQPVVFRAGRYVVHRMTTPARALR